MDDKYIDLLLTKCIDINTSKILFINYDIEIEEFIKKIEVEARKRGIEEIYLDKIDSNERYKILKNNTLEELENNKYFDKSIWDEYAKKNANFLIFETEQPHLMDDIEPEKISFMAKQSRESRPIYRKKVEHCEIPWCIAAYPGQRWADEVFKKSANSYQELKNAIYNICMINEENPIDAWDLQLNKNDKIIKYLNSLNLSSMHYKNSLGTDLTIYLPDNYNFESAKDNKVIVNMPSYEIFTSPIYNKTEGIVYSSMPLCYGGTIIDDFYLEFKEGKVVNYKAKTGEKVLKDIIESDEQSCYLGEAALVENNSPISNLNLVFGTTLIDENASCHLALGAGFPECIKGGLDLSDDELLKAGVNVSKNHVDFMIGTPDLTITGTTKEGKKVPIFINGNYTKELLSKCLSD